MGGACSFVKRQSDKVRETSCWSRAPPISKQLILQLLDTHSLLLLGRLDRGTFHMIRESDFVWKFHKDAIRYISWEKQEQGQKVSRKQMNDNFALHKKIKFHMQVHFGSHECGMNPVVSYANINRATIKSERELELLLSSNVIFHTVLQVKLSGCLTLLSKSDYLFTRRFPNIQTLVLDGETFYLNDARIIPVLNKMAHIKTLVLLNSFKIAFAIRELCNLDSYNTKLSALWMIDSCYDYSTRQSEEDANSIDHAMAKHKQLSKILFQELATLCSYQVRFKQQYFCTQKRSAQKEVQWKDIKWILEPPRRELFIQNTRKCCLEQKNTFRSMHSYSKNYKKKIFYALGQPERHFYNNMQAETETKNCKYWKSKHALFLDLDF